MCRFLCTFGDFESSIGDNKWLLDVHIRTYLVYVYIRQDHERERKVLISNE